MLTNDGGRAIMVIFQPIYSGATFSAGRQKKDWGRCWEVLDGRDGYGSGFCEEVLRSDNGC